MRCIERDFDMANNCPCTYGCPKSNHCDKCVAFHRQRGEFPACFFSAEMEKTYDRSFEALKRDRESGAWR